MILEYCGELYDIKGYRTVVQGDYFLSEDLRIGFCDFIESFRHLDGKERLIVEKLVQNDKF